MVIHFIKTTNSSLRTLRLFDSERMEETDTEFYNWNLIHPTGVYS